MDRSWRTAALLLAVGVALTALWGANQAQARRALESELAARYQQAFFDAVGHVENVEVLLSKGIAAASPRQLARVFSDVRDQALAAQASLTRLPLVQGALAETSKFLTQVGDFGFTIAKKAAAGTPPSDDEMGLMRRMREEAALISASLHQIQRESAGGRMPWDEIRSRANRRIAGRGGDGDDARGADGRGAQSDRQGQEGDDTGFTRLEDHFQRIPVIQYDGPFSDHVLRREPKGLTGDNVSEEGAEEAATAFLPAERKEGYAAEAVRRVEGRIPAYGVVARPRGRDGAEVVMDVSVKGGHVVWMLTKRDVTTTRISLEEAIDRARAFLKERGFGEMEPTYLTEAENVAVIPFVAVVDGVRIYPDLVKVSLALDNGEVVGFEALGYLMSHHKRDLPEPKIDADEARSRVAAGLEVTGEVRLAVIPLETREEVLTWEVPTRLGDDRFLVYINAETGDEENILRIVRSGEGEMTL